MKRFQKLVVVYGLMVISGLAVAWGDEQPLAEKKAQWQVTGTSATYLKWKGTDGEEPGTATNDGESYREEISVYITRTGPDNNRTGLDVRVRATNDEQVDEKEARLLYLRGYRETKSYRAALGDIAGSYNPYVFSTSLRGGKLDLAPYARQGFQAAFIGGVQKATWNEMVTTADNEQPDRWVGGIDTSYTFDAGQKIGLTLGFARDRINTGDFETVQAAGASAANAGMNVEWRFNRYVTLRSDMALMEGTDNLRDNKGYTHAHAIKARLLTKPLPRSLRSNFTYEYVNPDFAPLVGSGAADRERITNDTSYHFSRQLKFRLTLKHSRDNLSGTRPDTQHINDGVLYCDYRPDFLKRGDLGLRLQAKSVDGNGADSMLHENEVYFNVRPKSGWRLGGAYIYSVLDDDAAGAVDQDIHTVRGTVGWKKKLENDSLFRSTLRLDYRLLDQATGDQEKIGAGIDLGYDLNPYWSFDLAAMTNKNDRDEGDDTRYGNYQFRANFHPFKDRSKTLRLTAEQRAYRSDSTTSDQTYTENLVELAFIFGF